MGVNIEPSLAGYIRILNLIINRSTNDDDKAWAEAELERILNNRGKY